MKVAIYVVSKQAKQTYAEESFNVRKWPGMAIIKDALQRAGITVGYCGIADAHEQDVVLVSITAACDWWPYIAERQQWKQGKQRVIIGGAGVLNVRPFLQWGDAFVFGRAEDFVADLVQEMAAGREIKHYSVCYPGSFAGSTYSMSFGSSTYPHTVTLEDGNQWKERVIGCQNRCMFCGYTWQRRHIGGLHSSNSGDGLLGFALEKTLLELDLEHPEAWETKSNKLRIVAIDGFSERLRRKVNKPITRERLRAFFHGLAKIAPPHQIKIYNLVGLPGETAEDWREFKADLEAVDLELPAGKQWSIVLHNTPFRSMPATPAAHWPMSYRNYRGEIARALREPHHKGGIFFQGNRFWAVESMGTDSLATHILDAIVWRGLESDAPLVDRLALTAKFWKADSKAKIATLEHNFDVKRLFAKYPKGGEPTAYLKSWWNTQVSGEQT